MNKWKKAVALLLCGALLLTGCGGQGDGQPTALKDVQKAFSAAIEEDYSRTLSQRINQEGGEVRTAGSAQAERAAQLLAAEMEALGLENVTVEAFATDTWHTQMGSLTYAAGGREITVPIYTTPTLFDSQGVAEYALVYGGAGTAAELAGLDVAGKLVFLDLKAQEGALLAASAYEAHLAGAAAVVVSRGEIDNGTYTGDPNAPVLLVTPAVAEALAALLVAVDEAPARLEAQSSLEQGGTGYNVTGSIPGRLADEVVLVTAPYDTPVGGIEGGDTGAGQLLSIAKAMLASGYQPEKTLVFCATASDSWGDAQTGAGAVGSKALLEQHPAWVENAVAAVCLQWQGYDVAFDTMQIGSTYELEGFLEYYIQKMPAVEGLKTIFPDGVGISYPSRYGSSDFVYGQGGVMAAGTIFPQVPAESEVKRGDLDYTKYETTEELEAYNRLASLYQQQLYGMLVLACDHCGVPPVDFTERISVMSSTLQRNVMNRNGVDASQLEETLRTLRRQVSLAAEHLQVANEAYEQSLAGGDNEAADSVLEETAHLDQAARQAYSLVKDQLVQRWNNTQGGFVHQQAMENMISITNAISSLERGRVADALEENLWEVEGGILAIYYGRDTYTRYAKTADQGGIELYDVVQALLEGAENGKTTYTDEVQQLQQLLAQQATLLQQAVDAQVEPMAQLSEILAVLAA